MPPSATELGRDARHTHHPIVHVKEFGIESRIMRTECTVFLLASRRLLLLLIYEDQDRPLDSKESVGMQPQPT